MIETSLTPAHHGRFWAWVPVFLLGTMFIGLGSMAYVAIHDPSFALERDYYAKAVAWDTHQAQIAENSRLGWTITLTPQAVMPDNTLAFTATLRAQNSSLLEGAKLEVEAFANAAAHTLHRVPLREGDPGVFHGVLLNARPGLWEWRFQAELGHQHFSQTLRVDLKQQSTP